MWQALPPLAALLWLLPVPALPQQVQQQQQQRLAAQARRLSSQRRSQ